MGSFTLRQMPLFVVLLMSAPALAQLETERFADVSNLTLRDSAPPGEIHFDRPVRIGGFEGGISSMTVADLPVSGDLPPGSALYDGDEDLIVGSARGLWIVEHINAPGFLALAPPVQRYVEDLRIRDPVKDLFEDPSLVD